MAYSLSYPLNLNIVLAVDDDDSSIAIPKFRMSLAKNSAKSLDLVLI